MTSITVSAPGKIILCGEHAVVYGRPAIAAPVWQRRAHAMIEDAAPGQGCILLAPDVGLAVRLRDAAADQPLALVARLTLERAGFATEPDWTITLTSELPLAAGLGSGAALSTALVRAILARAGLYPSPHDVSELVYESERYYHGTPSGIDNTVIAWGQPIWFVRGQPPIPFSPRVPLHLLIADSGVRSPTVETVGDVRRGWEEQPSLFEAHFDAIAGLVTAARTAIETGALETLGRIFTANHSELAQIGVSSPRLDRLVQAALSAGALGAKLSGGGRGGNVIALVTPSIAAGVEERLLGAGAVQVITTVVER